MEVTELGKVIVVSPVQYSNVLDPIEVMECGMETEVSPVQWENA